LIAYYSPCPDYGGGSEAYLVYWFNGKGNYIDCNYPCHSGLTRIKEPAFAKDIVLYPDLLKPVTQTDIEGDAENVFTRSGFIDFEKRIVIIGTAKVNSSVLSSAIIDTTDDEEDHPEKGAVWSKHSWQEKLRARKRRWAAKGKYKLQKRKP
jgi:hypothetical protein